ncbi:MULTISPECIES: type II toxin-antitoxin system RelB/DinJ family antitoxin [Bartonella]|uniref:DNA-damage-inducible protein J n=3 Tax=Bartonella schoenbuchensis TaxID=165694 RepID=E6Z0T1_BARSR|nr:MULTISPECIES: type II toxin-antitoxin system RelB/DinJ family antitoxin [Bartonella]CDP79681.1 DNA-damage-inducible protein J [Bartonella schoenbuchensis]AQX31530.1 DNA-damage-inducible protein J [Bartonella schoenbuchensis R1]AQX31542.1 DNA-damage-inducible protein J [Bartonella schoenbuchensis R1]ENN90470.1 DNA-damage-inducible protein J [Bartonella schoenbuchensis m07a]OPB28369.1 DNA-damage-inducible protein J [Bartonella sp. WD12.1]
MDVATSSKDVIRARIDKSLKKEASAILANMGLTISDYVRIALTKVVNERGLPFDMHIPNAETLKTFEKTDKGEDVFYAKDATDLFKQLDI